MRIDCQACMNYACNLCVRVCSMQSLHMAEHDRCIACAMHAHAVIYEAVYKLCVYVCVFVVCKGLHMAEHDGLPAPCMHILL